GVWRGGACIYARAILEAFGETDRTVWVADSFAGLPPPDAEKYPRDKGDKHHKNAALAISRADVEEHFRLYGLLDDQVQFLEGWFKDTLPGAPIESLAVLRLDGDMYESTMDGLAALYDKVSKGGFVIVDDFGAVPACADAVRDFLAARNETVAFTEIDWTGVYWRKE
ncbi:MAG: TylF/MycF/NovP-related O-methyltransferase, partial [Pseudomonadota bacterium]